MFCLFATNKHFYRYFSIDIFGDNNNNNNNNKKIKKESRSTEVLFGGGAVLTAPPHVTHQNRRQFLGLGKEMEKKLKREIRETFILKKKEMEKKTEPKKAKEMCERERE